MVIRWLVVVTSKVEGRMRVEGGMLWKGSRLFPFIVDRYTEGRWNNYDINDSTEYSFDFIKNSGV